MKAAVLHSPQSIAKQPLRIEDIAKPAVEAGHVLLKVRACGVCRTDLHIVEGELPPRLRQLIPGHQIVGDVVDGATTELPMGTRVGVSWVGGIDGTCWYCRRGYENLCDAPTFTGYSVNGGYAEYAVGSRRLRVSLAAGVGRPACCAATVRRHHRISQPASRWNGAG